MGFRFVVPAGAFGAHRLGDRAADRLKNVIFKAREKLKIRSANNSLDMEASVLRHPSVIRKQLKRSVLVERSPMTIGHPTPPHNHKREGGIDQDHVGDVRGYFFLYLHKRRILLSLSLYICACIYIYIYIYDWTAKEVHSDIPFGGDF